MDGNGNKYQVLKFELRNSHFCVSLTHIEKVLQLMMLEPVPDCPPWLAGLMNKGGVSIPVLDLAIRFKLGRIAAYTVDTPVLLCSDGEHVAGLIVDRVSGLIEIDPDNQSLQKDSMAKMPAGFLTGSINAGNEMLLMIDMKKLLSTTFTLNKIPDVAHE